MVGFSEKDVVCFCEVYNVSSFVFKNGFGFLNYVDGFVIDEPFFGRLLEVCHSRLKSVKYLRFYIRKYVLGQMFFIDLLDDGLAVFECFCFLWLINGDIVYDFCPKLVFSFYRTIQEDIILKLEGLL